MVRKEYADAFQNQSLPSFILKKIKKKKKEEEHRYTIELKFFFSQNDYFIKLIGCVFKENFYYL